MRFIPLLQSSFDPAPWLALAPVMLRWDGRLHGAWPAATRRGLAVHAVHLAGASPVEEALDVLRQNLGLDFLVLPILRPKNREAGFRFLGQLATMLEATSGRGVKLALCLEADAQAPVLELLRQAHGEAVGFCWHPGVQDAESLADRLWCGVGEPGMDLRPLQVLGYRWDMALAATSPETFRVQAALLGAAHSPVLFPAEPPTTPLGGPVLPDDSVVFGRHLMAGPRQDLS